MKVTMENVVGAIRSERRFGRVHCGLSSGQNLSLAELAVEFGLDGDPNLYNEIDKTAALRLLEMVLSQDLAYNAEIMPVNRAADLASCFLSQFEEFEPRYFTNGLFHRASGFKLTASGCVWNPVTSATFDTGVLIVGSGRSGCLWVEEED